MIVRHVCGHEGCGKPVRNTKALDWEHLDGSAAHAVAKIKTERTG